MRPRPRLDSALSTLVESHGVTLTLENPKPRMSTMPGCEVACCCALSRPTRGEFELWAVLLLDACLGMSKSRLNSKLSSTLPVEM